MTHSQLDILHFLLYTYISYREHTVLWDMIITINDNFMASTINVSKFIAAGLLQFRISRESYQVDIDSDDFRSCMCVYY